MKIAYDLLLMAVLARVYQHCLPTADYQGTVALPDIDIIDLKSVCRRGSGGGGDGFARADHIGQHACFGQRRNNGDDNYQRQQKIFLLALLLITLPRALPAASISLSEAPNGAEFFFIASPYFSGISYCRRAFYSPSAAAESRRERV